MTGLRSLALSFRLIHCLCFPRRVKGRGFIDFAPLPFLKRYRFVRCPANNGLCFAILVVGRPGLGEVGTVLNWIVTGLSEDGLSRYTSSLCGDANWYAGDRRWN